MDQVNPRVHIEGNGILRIALRFAGVDNGGRLVEHIRREKLIGKHRRACGGNAQGPQSELHKESASVEFLAGRRGLVWLLLGHVYLGLAPANGTLGRKGPSNVSIEISPVGSAGTKL